MSPFRLPYPGQKIYDIEQWFLRIGNQIPFPFSHFPVKIGSLSLSANKLDRFLALWIWKFGGEDPFEHEILIKLCQPGMNIVDIGANIGRFTLQFAQIVGDRGHVWAFEPEEMNYLALQRNVHRNGFNNISTYHLAVGSKTEQGILYISNSHGGEHRSYKINDAKRRKKSVDFIALDDFFEPDQGIDLIKMDVQGAEGHVLAGMKRILSESKDLTILMEFCPLNLIEAGTEPIWVLEELNRLGFILESVDEVTKTLVPLAPTKAYIETIPPGSYSTILARREKLCGGLTD